MHKCPGVMELDFIFGRKYWKSPLYLLVQVVFWPQCAREASMNLGSWKWEHWTNHRCKWISHILTYASAQASTSAYRALINVHALAKLLARVHDALQPCLALPVPLMQDMSTIEKWEIVNPPHIPILRLHMDCGLRNAFCNTWNHWIGSPFTI